MRKSESIILPPAPSAIKQLWSECQKRLKRHAKEIADTIMKLIELGQALTDQHDRMEHGQWLPWLKANFGEGSQRTAYNFINLAKVAKFASVANIVNAVVHHGVPLTFLYEVGENLTIKSVGTTITLAKGIDLVTSYRFHRHEKKNGSRRSREPRHHRNTENSCSPLRHPQPPNSLPRQLT